jgi:hypothetical protein
MLRAFLRSLVAIALTAAPAVAGGSHEPGPGASPGPSPTAGPAVVYIWYADGSPAPSESACAGKLPPAYSCTFGVDIDDCKHQVQAYLDDWYADLNVVFTYNKPTSGQFFTVIVTALGGDWCNPGYDQRVGGVAPISCERILDDGTCYAFQCGHDSKTCATIISQEQAHLVGLEHTSSPTDAMYVYVSSTSDGFEDKENPVANSVCNRITQNSFQAMRDRLGLWPGGMKPDPFLDTVKGTLPAVAVYPGELQGSAYGCAIAGGDSAGLNDGSSDGGRFLVAIVALALLSGRRRAGRFDAR